MISAGWTPKAVQQVLGHRSVAFTLTAYGHLLNDDLDAFADALDSFSGGYGGGTTPPRSAGRARSIGPLTWCFAGSGGGTRTHNLRINSPPLCQLSYPGRVGHRCYRTRNRVRVYDAASMTTDPVRDRWAAGETAFAAWLTLESPASAAAVASAGFDAVVVDLQHGHATLEHLPHLLTAIEAGLPPSRSSAPRGTIPPT